MNTIFKTLLFINILFAKVFAQTHHTLTGIITNDRDEPIEGAVVSVETLKKQTLTDANGFFSFSQLPSGEYVVVIFQYGYHSQRFKVRLQEKPQVELRLKMQELQGTMSEVIVSEAQNSASDFQLRKLNAIEGFGIYEAKKTEVILVKDLTANLSTNNARQVFSRMAGVNVWESDCAGLQLGVGARGLSPNRTANFNTRQNGYDISADAIGYPESYYTPPMEALERIEIVRGAASLQYGTQFGGMLNFVMKDGPKDKKIEVNARQTIGSYRFLNSFNSIGGTVNKWRYYAFYQRKQGDCWRCNSEFENNMFYFSNTFSFSENFSLKLEHTAMNYLARQAGGLTQKLFEENPRQSLRPRNWFRVRWNMPALTAEYKITSTTSLHWKIFGMYSSREALGNLDRINKADAITPLRTLILDQYRNWGTEGRLLQRYQWLNQPSALLIGFRHYSGNTLQQQGWADGSDKPLFRYLPEYNLSLDYRFPNQNTAFFAENILNISEKFSLTPGIRFENIRTFSEGYYQILVKDAAGNIIVDKKEPDNRQRLRSFVLLGMGLSYKINNDLESYANFSQNYRAVTFGDLRIQNPNFFIDPNINDEKGYNADIGLRGSPHPAFYLDASLFYLRYNHKIGTVLKADQPPLYLDYQYRTNIADARTIGLELVTEVRLLALLHKRPTAHALTLFTNVTYNDGRYLRSDDKSIHQKRIELVPPVLLRTGLNYAYQNFKATLQYAYIAKQYTDATNASSLYTASAVIGPIPAYQVLDFSLKYGYRRWQIEGSINNLLNTMYYTRRATSYPGPGIIPAEGRTFYMTVAVKI